MKWSVIFWFSVGLVMMVIWLYFETGAAFIVGWVCFATAAILNELDRIEKTKL